MIDSLQPAEAVPRRLAQAQSSVGTHALSRPFILPCLPAALRRLLFVLRQRLERPALDGSLREAWTRLIPELESLLGRQPLRLHFEQAVSACHAARFNDTEGYLEFLYSATYDVLTDQTVRWLRTFRVQDDVESTAVDLVSQLFLELADSLFDGGDPGDGEATAQESRVPPPGRVLPWLFRALKHDVMDRAKAASNRLTRSIPSQPVETLVSRAPLLELSEPETLTPLELLERRNAFLTAFEKATQHLKPQHRRVLHLREVENLKPDALARRLSLTRQQVLDQLQYGREKRAELLLGQLIRHPATRDLEPEAHRLKRLLTRVSLSPLVSALSEGTREAKELYAPESLRRERLPSAVSSYVIGGLDLHQLEGGEPFARPPAFQSSGESPPGDAGVGVVTGPDPVQTSAAESGQSLWAEPGLSVPCAARRARPSTPEQLSGRLGEARQLEPLLPARRAALFRRSEKR